MPTRTFIKYSRTEPARTILGVVSVIALLAGLWLMTPWAVYTASSSAVVLGFDLSAKVGALCTILFSLPGIWAVRKGTPKALSQGAMWLFCWFLFIALVRFITLPLGTTTFVFPVMVALVLAVVHIEQAYLVRVAERSVDE